MSPRNLSSPRAAASSRYSCELSTSSTRHDHVLARGCSGAGTPGATGSCCAAPTVGGGFADAAPHALPQPSSGYNVAMASEARVITGNLARRGADEAAFDQAFWRAVTPEKRLEALWEMVLEARVWQGAEGDQPRLQRSTARLQRR